MCSTKCLGICHDFSQIPIVTRLPSARGRPVHCEPTGSTRGSIARRTSWLASSGASVVIHSHVKTEHQRAPFPRTPRRGNGDQSDAQQVRAAGQPHRLRLTRARFGRHSRPLPRALIAPCLRQGMNHGYLPYAVMMRLPKLCSARLTRETTRSGRARRSV